MALFYCDFKLDGQPQLIVCSASGAVTGYRPAEAEAVSAARSIQGSAVVANTASKSDEQWQLNELYKTKRELQLLIAIACIYFNVGVIAQEVCLLALC